MGRSVHMHILPLLLIVLIAAPGAWADDNGQNDFSLVTTTADFPAEKAVYNELRTLNDVQIGTTAPLPWSSPSPAPRLYILETTGEDALRIDAQPNSSTPALLVDDAGRVGLHTAAPDRNARLDVNGATNITGRLDVPETDFRRGHLRLNVHVSGATVTRDGQGELVCSGCIDAADVKPPEVQLRVDHDGVVDDDPATDKGCVPPFAIQEIYENGTVKCIKVTRRAR